MMATEEDDQSVGYTDMRLWLKWLAMAPMAIQLAARLYPPGVYRMTSKEGEVLRVIPHEYVLSRDGDICVHVIAPPSVNPEHLYMAPFRITDVPLSSLEPLKWPPDARVH